MEFMKMGKDFEVTIYDEKRKKDFIKVFGTDTVKVKSPVPTRIIKPDGEEALAYFLDLALITKKERKKLIKHISEKFNQSIDFVEKNLDKMGLPILKESCSLVINNPQRWI